MKRLLELLLGELSSPDSELGLCYAMICLKLKEEIYDIEYYDLRDYIEAHRPLAVELFDARPAQKVNWVKISDFSQYWWPAIRSDEKYRTKRINFVKYLIEKESENEQRG